MNKTAVYALLFGIALSVSGCGGFYVLTVPDHVASTEGDAVATLRLQRNDFFFMTLPEKRRPMRFSILKQGGSGEDSARSREKSARSDPNGYAGVTFSMDLPPVKRKPGVYVLSVDLQDIEGEQLHSKVPLYVWDPARPVVAVEFDILPFGAMENNDAASALTRLSQKANILYLTGTKEITREYQHEMLKGDGYPDGPILFWQRAHWRVDREVKTVGSVDMTLMHVRFDPRLVSMLPQLIKDFPGFKTGIFGSTMAGEAFLDAGLKCIAVGTSALSGSGVEYYPAWSELNITP